jgi:hypothetical protein
VRLERLRFIYQYVCASHARVAWSSRTVRHVCDPDDVPERYSRATCEHSARILLLHLRQHISSSQSYILGKLLAFPSTSQHQTHRSAVQSSDLHSPLARWRIIHHTCSCSCVGSMTNDPAKLPASASQIQNPPCNPGIYPGISADSSPKSPSTDNLSPSSPCKPTAIVRIFDCYYKPTSVAVELRRPSHSSLDAGQQTLVTESDVTTPMHAAALLEYCKPSSAFLCANRTSYHGVPPQQTIKYQVWLQATIALGRRQLMST